MNKEEKKKSAFRNKKEKSIIYPKLLECSNLEENEQWKIILYDMAKGSCPKGLTIQNGTLSGYSSKKNNISYYFINDDPQVIIDTIKEQYSNIINIESSKRNNELDNINKFYNEYKKLDWKNIKKKSIREILIQDFVLKLVKQYKIKKNLIKKIYEDIMNAFYFLKTHKNPDVEYKNGEIISIQDIEYCSIQKTIVNKRVSSNIISTILDEEVEDQVEEEIEEIEIKSNVDLKHVWELYLNNLCKNVDK